MKKISVPASEFHKLQKQAKAYQNLTGRLFEFIIQNDPISEVLADFKKTNRYSPEFLKDLENGLRKSSYSKNKR